MITARGEGWRHEIGMPGGYIHDDTTEPSAFKDRGAESEAPLFLENDYEQDYPLDKELIYGEYETVKVPVSSLVRLPQVRSGLNPDLPDLKESIKTNGLLNPIDIAVMDETALLDYIDFTNRLWGKDVHFEDYASLRQSNGTYSLVIAGHTRAEAISQLQSEDDMGRQHSIICKIHHATDPHSIISLQLDENIHSKPSLERRATALVEAWLYGVEKGLWKNKAEFLRSAGKKFNSKNLNDAIAFSQLPSGIRDFVFEGNISYGASVELGKNIETVRDYVRIIELGGEEAGDDPEKTFDTAFHMRLGEILQQVFSGGMGVGKSMNYIKHRVTEMEASLGRAERQIEIPLFSQADQYSMGYEKIKKEYLASLQETNKLAREKREKQLRIQRRLTQVAELPVMLDQVSRETVEDLAAA